MQHMTFNLTIAMALVMQPALSELASDSGIVDSRLIASTVISILITASLFIWLIQRSINDRM